MLFFVYKLTRRTRIFIRRSRVYVSEIVKSQDNCFVMYTQILKRRRLSEMSEGASEVLETSKIISNMSASWYTFSTL